MSVAHSSPLTTKPETFATMCFGGSTEDILRFWNPSIMLSTAPASYASGVLVVRPPPPSTSTAMPSGAGPCWLTAGDESGLPSMGAMVDMMCACQGVERQHGEPKLRVTKVCLDLCALCHLSLCVPAVLIIVIIISVRNLSVVLDSDSDSRFTESTCSRPASTRGTKVRPPDKRGARWRIKLCRRPNPKPVRPIYVVRGPAVKVAM